MASLDKDEQDKGVPVKQQPITSVWMFSREYGGLAGAGGVKDVVSQLAASLAR